MAYDGWMTYNNIELFNLARTTQLAERMNIDTVWMDSGSVQWIATTLGQTNLHDITKAPWYNANDPASSEFAGVMPLSMEGLNNSTFESTPIEYVIDGGHSGRGRHGTLTLVASVALVAQTERGAEFGKRWLNRILKSQISTLFCAGAPLEYFRYAEPGGGAPRAHRRDVKLTRGVSITARRSSSCSATWMATFTMVAADPFEYGPTVPLIEGLGNTTPTGAALASHGALTLLESPCPEYSYDPIYDPGYPALVQPPTAPEYYPDGWSIEPGDTFFRFWARLDTQSLLSLSSTPTFIFDAPNEARMVRASIFPAGASPSDQCNAVMTAILTYVPGLLTVFVDGKERASYAWDGASPAVRRVDSLLFSRKAKPLQWVDFDDLDGCLLTFDIFATEDDGDGWDQQNWDQTPWDEWWAANDPGVRLSLSATPKTD